MSASDLPEPDVQVWHHPTTNLNVLLQFVAVAMPANVCALVLLDLSETCFVKGSKAQQIASTFAEVVRDVNRSTFLVTSETPQQRHERVLQAAARRIWRSTSVTQALGSNASTIVAFYEGLARVALEDEDNTVAMLDCVQTFCEYHRQIARITRERLKELLSWEKIAESAKARGCRYTDYADVLAWCLADRFAATFAAGADASSWYRTLAYALWQRGLRGDTEVLPAEIAGKVLAIGVEMIRANALTEDIAHVCDPFRAYLPAWCLDSSLHAVVEELRRACHGDIGNLHPDDKILIGFDGDRAVVRVAGVTDRLRADAKQIPFGMDYGAVNSPYIPAQFTPLETEES